MVPSISIRGRGSITQNGNLWKATKLEFIKQSDELELISPRKSFKTGFKYSEMKSDFGLDRAIDSIFNRYFLMVSR